MDSQPLIIVLAGPNGAGKSTAASVLIPAEIPYVNADEVAKGLPGYPSPGADVLAGRLVIETMAGYEDRRESFAVETTLATRSLAQRIIRLRRSGWRFVLHFLWTPSAEFSIQRVTGRVRLGGHSIPVDVIHRRHKAGLQNLFRYYIPIADEWSVRDNTEVGGPLLIAKGGSGRVVEILDETKWSTVRKGGDDEA